MTVPIGVPAWRSSTGPAGPTPPRQPNSLRRTSSLDMRWQHGTTELRLLGAARDLYTGATPGDHVTVAATELRMDVDTADAPVVTSVTTSLGEPVTGLEGLIGQSPITGFRKVLAAEYGQSAPRGSLTRLLLHEVPIASVVAWSALGRHGLLAAEIEQQHTPPANVCAGWRKGGHLDTATARGYSFYAIDCPVAPSLDRPDDPVAWHPTPPLTPGSVRRRRRMDVVFPAEAGGEITADAFFRDAHVDPDGMERALHEYSVRATVAPGRRVITSIQVNAGALPSGDCPAALLAVSGLAGERLDDLDGRIRATLRGTASCTHLNDVLLSLADLWSIIPADGPPRWRG